MQGFPDTPSVTRELLEKLQVGVLLQGPKAEILFSNPAASKLLGLTEEQLLGKVAFDPSWNVVQEDGTPLTPDRHPVSRTIASHAPQHNTVLGVHHPNSHERVWLQVSTEPQFNEQGDLRHVVTTLTDITAQKQVGAGESSNGSSGDSQRYTAQLRVAAEIAERLNAFRDTDELLREVVSLLQSRFDLYHVHIYLHEPVLNALIVQAGSGEAGRQLREKGHRISMDQEKSLVVRSARNREHVLVDDTRDDPDFLPNPLLPDTRSELAIPLVARGGKLIGVLDVQDDQPHHFTPSDVSVLTTVAGQIASALDNARLFELTQASLANTRARLEVSQALATALTDDEIYDTILSYGALYPQAQLIIATFDWSKPVRTLEVVRCAAYESDLGDIPPGVVFDETQVPVVKLYSAHESFVSPHMINDPRADDGVRAVASAVGIVSTAVIPITIGNEWVGVLGLGSKVEGYFDENKVLLYEALADQGANALRAARLRAEAEHYTRQLQTAAEMASQVNSILDLDQLLAVTVAQLQHRFDLYHVHVYLVDEATNRLVLQRGSGEVGEKMRSQGHAIVRTQPRSIVARAARNQEVVLVNDVSEDPNFLPNPLLPDTQSEVAVPLIAGDTVLGVFDVQDNRPNRFTTSELDVFRTLAGQIASAVQNARLFEQVERSLEQTRIRLDVSQALAEAQTEEDVLNVMIEQADFFPNALVNISLQNQEATEQDITVVKVNSALSQSNMMLVGTRYTASEFPLLKDVNPPDILRVSDIEQDERLNEAGLNILRALGIRSLAIIPVMRGNAMLAHVTVLSPEPGFVDDYRKLYLYQALAEQGAVALVGARLYDESLRTADRLRELDRLKSEFLANMSHELRTPLNSIIGYAEIMLMGINGPLNEDNTEDVQAIRNSGQHLLRLINDILDLAKIEAGRMVLDLEDVNIESLLDEVRVNQTGHLHKKPLELAINVDPSIPTLRADRLRLSQILTNLLGNAIKFTDEGLIEVNAVHDDGWLSIHVKDTGIGISKADMDKIFEEFRQVDGSSTRRAEGTGLGLAITRHLVQMHGGSISVQSELGAGSTFTVHLPVIATWES